MDALWLVRLKSNCVLWVENLFRKYTSRFEFAYWEIYTTELQFQYCKI